MKRQMENWQVSVTKHVGYLHPIIDQLIHLFNSYCVVIHTSLSTPRDSKVFQCSLNLTSFISTYLHLNPEGLPALALCMYKRRLFSPSYDWLHPGQISKQQLCTVWRNNVVWIWWHTVVWVHGAGASSFSNIQLPVPCSLSTLDEGYSSTWPL